MVKYDRDELLDIYHDQISFFVGQMSVPLDTSHIISGYVFRRFISSISGHLGSFLTDLLGIRLRAGMGWSPAWGILEDLDQSRVSFVVCSMWLTLPWWVLMVRF